MKIISVIFLSVLVVSFIGYSGAEAIEDHIDRKSGAIVERRLSDNTISQLELLSEVQALIASGNISEASAKISKRRDTLEYILSSYCDLPKCAEALKKHDIE